MNYLVLIIVALAGIALGVYMAKRRGNDGFIAKQVEQKTENKQKILAFVQEHGPTSPRLRRARKFANKV